jgi:hypothetical protein
MIFLLLFIVSLIYSIRQFTDLKSKKKFRIKDGMDITDGMDIRDGMDIKKNIINVKNIDIKRKNSSIYLTEDESNLLEKIFNYINDQRKLQVLESDNVSTIEKMKLLVSCVNNNM